MLALISWLLSFFFIILLLAIVGFQLMCLTDLEFDYINPYDSASRINKAILPEFIAHAILCFIQLVTGHWLMFLWSLPFLYYNVRLYMRRHHFIDVTEVYNHLAMEKNKRLFKFGYLIIQLCASIFWYHDIGCYGVLRRAILNKVYFDFYQVFKDGDPRYKV